MKKILVSFKATRGESQFLTAGSKAPADVRRLALESGFFEEFVEYNNNGRLISLITRTIAFAHLLLRLPKGSKLLIQYPFLPLVVNCFFAWIMRSKFYCIAVVHDLNSLRAHGHLTVSEKGALLAFKKLIVHTPSMKELLKSQLTSEMEYEVLEVFPYLIKSEGRSGKVVPPSNTVVFAGNLHKSLFLRHLSDRELDYMLFLYGADYPFADTRSIFYKGSFKPNDVEGVEGAWGLVWDGESSDECAGYYGEYLRIIASHKLSLYLACGKPVIVWRKSAMAFFVSKYRIGILVDRLDQVGQAIREADYESMVENVETVSRNYIAGLFLLDILKRV